MVVDFGVDPITVGDEPPHAVIAKDSAANVPATNRP